MAIGTIQSGFGKAGIYSFNNKAVRIGFREDDENSTSILGHIPSSSISGPISNHPLLTVANLPANLVEVLLTPKTSTKK